jgi:hypothetical protein
MKGNIVGDPIIPIIDEQIDIRQKLHGAGYNENSIKRTPEVLNILNNKNAWIKLASGTELLDTNRLINLQKLDGKNYFTNNDIASLNGIELAKNFILFNSTQALTQGAEFTTTGTGTDSVTTQTRAATYNRRSGVRNTKLWSENNDKLYGGMGGSSRGLQPVPGITDIKVESINRGSIRKATVNLKAYNKFQFGIIEILYLRLGHLMMLEWGWDKFVSKIDENNKPVIENVQSTIIENIWFKDKNYTQLEMLQQINVFVDRYKGNYQGFFGKVNNFSWKLNQDNTYDITVNLITIGSVIESMSVSVPSPPISAQSLAQRKTALKGIYKLNPPPPEEGQEPTTSTSSNSVINNLGTDRLSTFIAQQIETFISAGLQNNKDYLFLPNVLGQNTGDDVSDININRGKIPPTSQYFIRFGELIKKIENNVILRVKNGNSESIPRIKFETSEEYTRISYEPNLIPLDPSICVFQPVYTADLGIVGNVNVPTFKDLKTYVKEKDGVYYGELMNVYLNMNFVSKTLSNNKDKKGNVTLFDFLQKLLDGINKCMGNVCELTTSIKDDNVIYFLDENPIQGYELISNKRETKSVFNIIGYNSNGSSTFVKDFNFQTKITPKLLNQISIGAADPKSPNNSTDAVGFLNLNKGLRNRFEDKYQTGPTDNFIPPVPKETVAKQAVEDNNKKYNELYEKFKKEARWTGGSGFYSWSYKGYNKNYRGDETSKYSFNSTNFKDETLKSQVIESIKEIDSTLAGSDLEIVTPNSQAVNDYPTYLLDAFGGTGTKKILVKTEDLYTTEKKSVKIGSEGGKPIYATQNVKTLKNPNQNPTEVPAIEGTVTGIETGQVFINQEVGTSDALYWYTTENPDFIDRAFNMWKRYKTAKDTENFRIANKVNGGTGFIPVSLGLNIEGIGGIKIYNSIKINQKALPSSYPTSLNFLVDGVNHTIKDNKWETNISTISTPRTTKGEARKVLDAKSVYVKGKTRAKGSGGTRIVKPWTGDPAMAKTITSGYSLIAPTSNGLVYWDKVLEPKIQITLHHTAGLNSVESVIKSWCRKDEHVSCHFIIQRSGFVEQLFPLKYYGNHLGSKLAGASYLQRATVSIELQALGYVKVKGTSKSNSTFNKDSIFVQSNKEYTYEKLQQGQPDVPVAEPYKMKPDGTLVKAGDYKGYGLYHAYTKKQLNSLAFTLARIKATYPNITINSRYSGGNAFYEQFPDKKNVAKTAYSKNRGTFTHNSYKTSKSDIFPQKEMIEMLQKFND